MALVESGVDYCRAHHGIRNEDEDRCDMVTREPWDSHLNCPRCGGQGDDVAECEACDADGVSLCDLDAPALRGCDMSRLMSVTLTEQAVVERRKTVTRRLGWLMLKPGDTLTLCRKVMGRKGEPLVRLAEVEVLNVRRERLWDITDEDIGREGVEPVPGRFSEHYTDTGQPTPWAWIEWFCTKMRVSPDDFVTRIEWRYLDSTTQGASDRLVTATTNGSSENQ